MYKGNIKLKKEKNTSNNSKLNLIMVVLIATIIILVTILSYTAFTQKETSYKNIEIEDGQTLWEIVESEFGNNVDIRKYVYQIKKINNLQNSNIHPGQIIKIPIKKEV